MFIVSRDHIAHAAGRIQHGVIPFFYYNFLLTEFESWAEIALKELLNIKEKLSK